MSSSQERSDGGSEGYIVLIVFFGVIILVLLHRIFLKMRESDSGRRSRYCCHNICGRLMAVKMDCCGDRSSQQQNPMDRNNTATRATDVPEQRNQTSMDIYATPTTMGGGNNRPRSAEEQQLPPSYESLMEMARYETTIPTAPSMKEVYF